MLGVGSALSALAARFNGLSGPEIKAMVQAAASQRLHPAFMTPRVPHRRVRFVRGHHVDRSRYSGAMLRALRAERGCGRPPKVLAARRARQQGSASA
ncbi:hypothetical protein [Xanthobacter sp. 91]|uniref:hypothetical protein n=1 Tax=Xanthobacter sp. 91 TaxID=1117244 RepID=UPI00049823D9|nr:hypothetical protein [Xanthobacter sp. 91]